MNKESKQHLTDIKNEINDNKFKAEKIYQELGKLLNETLEKIKQPEREAKKRNLIIHGVDEYALPKIN